MKTSPALSKRNEELDVRSFTSRIARLTTGECRLGNFPGVDRLRRVCVTA